uniref:Glycos_transf_1 domain-containing protein n=1 Tax=Syphacia muris TaxID=451379 RepID=A0A0N5AEA7_9BILA
MQPQQAGMAGNAVLVVVGDIGRSPRMCYHAHSLANNNYFVELVGYMDSLPDEVIYKHPNIRFVSLRSVPKFIESSKLFSKHLQMLLKCLWIYIVLLFALLFRIQCPTFIMMQNPPGVPTMFVCWLAAKLYRARLIIDWHNYTMVSMVQKFEGFFGQHADLNICVTASMRHNLQQQLGCSAVTVYDKPPSWKFKRLDDEQRHKLYLQFSKSSGLLSLFAANSCSELEQESTLFSYRDLKGVVHLRSDRPLLLISSTSWTEDEDFRYLWDALVDYDDNSSGHLPPIFCVVTGNGPKKAEYLEIIKKLNLSNVTIITPWLEAEDYPRLLGSADVGISLHTSTSGLDLPMKALDMLGSGLPVVAKRFSAINELIKVGENGDLFDNSTELCRILKDLAFGFPSNSEVTVDRKLDTLSTNVRKNCTESWESNWNAKFLPHVQDLTRLS